MKQQIFITNLTYSLTSFQFKIIIPVDNTLSTFNRFYNRFSNSHVARIFNNNGVLTQYAFLTKSSMAANNAKLIQAHCNVHVRLIHFFKNTN